MDRSGSGPEGRPGQRLHPTKSSIRSSPACPRPGDTVYLKPLLDAYIAGITPENLDDRVQTLCFKLRRVPTSDHHRRELTLARYGSIEDSPAFGEDELFPSLSGHS